MKKLIFNQTTLLVILFLSFFSPVEAQKKKQDVVYLKNGSVIRGTIESQSEDKLSIRTQDHSVWVFEQSEVLRKEQQNMHPPDYIKKGMYASSSLGLLQGRNEWRTRLYPSLQSSIGYQFSKRWSGGVGLGLEQYDDNGYLPMNGEVRFQLLDNAVTPYTLIQGGYSVPLTNWYDDEGKKMYLGGFNFGAQLGICKYIRSRSAIMLSAGYRFQQTKSNQTIWWWEQPGSKFVRINNYHSFEVRLGFLFR